MGCENIKLIYEKVLSLLNIKSSGNIENIGPPSTNRSGINSVEAAGLLSGLSGPRLAMGWMYILEDYSVFHVAFDKLQDIVWKKSVKENWKWPETPILDSMVRLAIIESLAPGLCKECRGRKQNWDFKNNIIVECKKCKGTGRGSAFTETRRAKIIGLDRTVYEKKWAVKYRIIYNFPDVWLGDVFRHVTKKYTKG